MRANRPPPAPVSGAERLRLNFGLGVVVVGLCVLCLLRVLGTAVIAAAPPSIDAAFQRFWAAHDPQEAAKAAQDVIASGD